MVFLGNYGTSFRIWDWAFGTDRWYNTWKASQKEKAVGGSTGVTMASKLKAQVAKDE